MCESVEYDNLNVAVRRDKVHDLMRYYRALGWENTAVREYGSSGRLLDMSFRRPHFIAQRDQLQLLQVYLETALNTEGWLERMPRPKTFFFCLFGGLLSLALIAAGLSFVFLAQTLRPFVFGWVLFGMGAAFALTDALFTVQFYRLEGVVVAKRWKEAKEEIERVCAEAERILAQGEVRDER